MSKRDARPAPLFYPLLALFAASAGELAAQTWTQLAAPPITRRFHAMAFDDARGRGVVFGGWDNTNLLGDTWEYDGTTWTNVSPAVAPSPRRYHAMVYDARRGRVVLFGGADLVAAFTDTWEYDGATWTQIPTTTAPSLRYHATIAYDTVRARIVLFGGSNATGLPLADTWALDGATWTQLATPVAPPARSRASLTFDARRDRLVLFGGFDSTAVSGSVTGQCLGDTWDFDGTTWTQVVTALAPAPRSMHWAVFDRVRGRTMIFGGSGNLLQGGHSGSGATIVNHNDTWSFDGATWTAVPVPTWQRPAARFAAGAAVDGRTGVAWLFSGGTQTMLHGDVWRLDPAPAASWTRYGTACAGSAGTPQLDRQPGSLPALGGTFGVALSGLPVVPGVTLLAVDPETVRIGPLLLPLELDPSRAPCLLWTSPFGAGLVLVHAGPTAAVAFAVPASPALQGSIFALQAFSLDAGVGAGFTPSNAGIVRLW